MPPAIGNGVELRIGRRAAQWRPIDSWAHASAEVRGFVEAHDLTASGETGPMFSGGRVKDGRGCLVARVSYNGCVWGPAPWQSGAVPLYDPRETCPTTTTEER